MEYFKRLKLFGAFAFARPVAAVFQSCIDCGHLCLKLVDVILREWRNGFLLPRELYPFCDKRDGVFRAHCEAGIIGDESCLFPSGMMSGVVASDDAIDLPPFQVMKKFLAWEAYLAHEELVQFVGVS